MTTRSELWKGGPYKALTEGLSKTGGRNSQGRCSAPVMFVVTRGGFAPSFAQWYDMLCMWH